MALLDPFDSALRAQGWRPAARRYARLAVASGALAIGLLVAASPATAAVCKFAPVRQIDKDAGVEPQLLIDGTCTDPVYNDATFVVDKTEQLTFQVPGGPLIPYTQISGHFPATNSLATLPPNVLQSPTTFQQNYVFRFPAKEYWHNRSFQVEHPTSGGIVDNRMAFTDGAYSVNWMSAGTGNSVASHRHEAAATKVSKTFADKLYGNTGKIYSYLWGCSGGGTVAMAAAENVTGVWDGVEVQCTGTKVDAQYHSFYWQALYTMAIPEAKQNAIAAAALPGGTGDVYAGLNDEEKSVLNEFIAAGYPLPAIGNHFKSLTPLVDPIDVRMFDMTYEDDFWSKPGYAGANPPNYLKAALTDGFATITGITRNDQNVPTVIQFDPATVPTLGTTGDNYLEYFVYGADGKTRLIDPKRALGTAAENKRRFSLIGKLDTAKGTLTLTEKNSPLLLDALKVGGKVRINNRFILAMYYYPRYSIFPEIHSHDQYRNADGSPKYPQRPFLDMLNHSSYRTMGGRVETGDIKTKVMLLEGMSDNLSWPIFNASYAEEIQKTLGPAKANAMMRFYIHNNGRHAQGAGEPGIFRQSILDMIAWVEKGIAPPPSSRYTIRNGQVILAPEAAERHGLQPVMHLTANGVSRATVAVNQPVNLAAKLEMPPATGKVVQYFWTVSGNADAPTNLPTPKVLVDVNRTMSFDKPDTYVVRLTVNGQRNGLLDPADDTLLENFQEVRVVVQ